MTRLIPEVDRVFLGAIGDADTAFMVRRADAIDIAGRALVLQVGYDPPRWRYRGWPDDEAITALRQRAVPLRND
jgi:hypothetical protein